MDTKEKKNSEKKFHEGGFDFKKFEKMAGMMRNCRPGQGGIMDCCSMMRKMMEKKEGKETKKKNKDTGKKE